MTQISKFIKPFFSMLTTGLLLVIFGIAIGYATFVENDYGTTTARILIYNAKWFELLMILLAVNLVGSIFHHKLIPQKKWSVLLFHAAFLVILAGAAITRYSGFEGTLHIREGEQNNQLLTEGKYIGITAKSGDQTVNLSRPVSFTPYTGSDFSETFEIAGKEVTVTNQRYVPSATESVVEDPSGEPIVSLMAANMNSERIDFNLKRGDSKSFEGITFAFGPSADSSTVSISLQNDSVFLTYADSIFRIVMGDENYGAYSPGTLNPFEEKVIYQAGTVGFVLKKYIPKGKSELIYVPSHSGTMTHDALDIEVTSGSDARELFVYGKSGEPGKPVETVINDITVSVSYGSVFHELPFSLKLNDFQIERYPGSKSPSSFASEVTLIDPVNNIEKPYRIFMNNILKHEGYRFFQSSYDEDEMGTILSVNYDSTGTTVTYIGYFLMTLGMILALFSRKSRFLRLARASARLGTERKKMFAAVLFALLLLPAFSASGQNNQSLVSARHSGEFGTLLVQNNEGRIEPVNTLASEVLRKVAKKGTWNGMEPVQVLMEIMAEPEKWKNEEMIRVGDPELRRILGARDKYIAFNHAFENGDTEQYKLQELVEAAYAKKPAERNKFDKEVINVDERINILYKLFSGGFLTIYPVPGDASNKWVAITEAVHSEDQEFSDFARMTYSSYFSAVQQAKASGNYAEADKLLSQLKENQKKNGAAVYPPAAKVKLELFYINHNIFSKLAKFYVLVGLILLVVQFSALLSYKNWTKKADKAGLWIVLALFAIHSAGLAIRWYISGHAPWSNGYETLLYISWATCLAGLTFARRSPMTLAVTTILSAISLFVAGMSWMSPELTNLVPVLKSYWLVIHVAVITASYGFFAMAALLGLVNLVLIILLPALNSERIRFTIKELVLIIQMAIIVGLYMMTIGSFLGGVWANESWGRYWGWDPKETWAMVTIVVYAFIIHMHKIPGFKGSYAMSLAAVIGLASVLMTFFGVNYYLSGLHSYAQGEPAPIPSGVYVAVFLVLIIGLTAFLSERRLVKAGAGNSAEEEI